MATPHVAGAVAVLKGQQPDPHPGRCRIALAASATPAWWPTRAPGRRTFCSTPAQRTTPAPAAASAPAAPSLRCRCVRQVQSVERRADGCRRILGDTQVERFDQCDQLRTVPRHDQQQHLRFHVDQLGNVRSFTLTGLLS